MFAPVVEKFFDLIYELAYRMTLDAADAAEIVLEAFRGAFRDAAGGQDIGMLILEHAVEHAEIQQRRRHQLNFDELDAMIRNDPTQSGVFDQLTAPERNELLWNLKQGCLTAVLNCLPPGERVAFILVDVLGQGPEVAARLLSIKQTALRVRVSRARNKVSGYLSPRCEHVNPRNPCRCPSRLGVALKRGFIGNVQGRQVTLRDRPFDAEQPAHDPLALYQNLPRAVPPPALREQLLAELEADQDS